MFTKKNGYNFLKLTDYSQGKRKHQVNKYNTS